MEIEIIALKKELKNAIEAAYIDSRFTERCDSLLKMLFVLNISVKDTLYRKKIILQYKLLISILLRNEIEKPLNVHLDEIEKYFVNILVIPLRLLNSDFETYYRQAKNKSYTISGILSNVINFYLERGAQAQRRYEYFWLHYLIQILGLFNIENSYYLKQLAKVILCDDNLISDDIKVNNLSYFCSQIFENPKSVKFLYNASSVYKKMEASVGIQQQVHTNNKSLEIICTRVNENVPTTPDTVSLLKKYSVRPFGLEYIRNRCDSFVTFGKSPLADIKFPSEDKSTSDLSFAIYYNGLDYYVVDCSKKMVNGISPVDLKILLHPNMPYPVKQDMIINLGDQANIEVKKIEIDIIGQQEYGILTLELNQRNFSFKSYIEKTHTKKCSYLIGKRQNSYGSIDYLIDNYEIADGHALFTCSDNCNWTITDELSMIGTFVLVKQRDEFIERKFSKCKNLFFAESINRNEISEIEYNSDQMECLDTLHFARYSFFIKQTNHDN